MLIESCVRLPHVLRDRSHFAWVLIQHVFGKCFFAAKFLLAARLLGPEQLGLVGVALAALAIVESLSDTGILQALIQREALVSRIEAGAVWTLQVARGLLLLVVLYLFSTPIAGLFGIAAAAPLISLAALLPLLRSALNPGYAILQRNRQFRTLAASESIVSLFDLMSTYAFISAGFGATSVLIGTLIADIGRLVLSWTAFRMLITVSFAWSAIKSLGQYGRWIWGTSVLTVILNQFDKILVARWLGTTQFGMYQTASRLAQMAVADVSIALGGFLFPTISILYHKSPSEAHAYFSRALCKIGAICGGLAITSIVVGPAALNVILGPAWSDMTPIFRIQCIAMWLGSLIAVCVAYLRAIGKPAAISMATVVQFLILTLPSYWVVQGWGNIGMAILVAVSLSASFATMYYQINDGN